MHFDEVYHARTATEFLQFWRYGMPHDIYEYTHPHLAKYAMAAGLVAFGDNQVTSQGDLGVPVNDAAIEAALGRSGRCPAAMRATACMWPRAPRSGPTTCESRAARRHDRRPGRDGTSPSTDRPSPLHRHRLGRDRVGRYGGDLDPLRAHPASPTTGPPTEPFASVGAPVDTPRSAACHAGLLAATAADDVVSLDDVGTELARAHIAGVRSWSRPARPSRSSRSRRCLPTTRPRRPCSRAARQDRVGDRDAAELGGRYGPARRAADSVGPDEPRRRHRRRHPRAIQTSKTMVQRRQLEATVQQYVDAEQQGDCRSADGRGRGAGDGARRRRPSASGTWSRSAARWRKPPSNSALWAVKIAPFRRAPNSASTASSGGAPFSVERVMPWTWVGPTRCSGHAS